MFAPNLYFQFVLVTLIALLAAVSGKWQYALRGMIAYALICLFTVWCMGVLSGTWRTMFVAFLGLVHKVYACGMLAGLLISTTKVGEFLSAMARLHIPKKLTIPIAVMLRYLPTIREDWHYIKGCHALAGCFTDALGLSESTCHDDHLHLCAAFNGGKQGSGRAVYRLHDAGHRKSKPRTCLINIQMQWADLLALVLFAAFLVMEIVWKTVGV